MRDWFASRRTVSTNWTFLAMWYEPPLNGFWYVRGRPFFPSGKEPVKAEDPVRLFFWPIRQKQPRLAKIDKLRWGIREETSNIYKGFFAEFDRIPSLHRIHISIKKINCKYFFSTFLSFFCIPNSVISDKSNADSNFSLSFRLQWHTTPLAPSFWGSWHRLQAVTEGVKNAVILLKRRCLSNNSPSRAVRPTHSLLCVCLRQSIISFPSLPSKRGGKRFSNNDNNKQNDKHQIPVNLR